MSRGGDTLAVRPGEWPRHGAEADPGYAQAVSRLRQRAEALSPRARTVSGGAKNSHTDGRDAADRTIPASRSPLKRPLRTRGAVRAELFDHATAVLEHGDRTWQYGHLKSLADEIEALCWPEAQMYVQAVRLTVEADEAMRDEWRVVAFSLMPLVEKTARAAAGVS